MDWRYAKVGSAEASDKRNQTRRTFGEREKNWCEAVGRLAEAAGSSRAKKSYHDNVYTK